MSTRRSRLGRRLGTVVLVPIAAVAMVAVATRLERALDPAAASSRTRQSVSPPDPAETLSEPPGPTTGFAGPDRLEDAPVPVPQEARTWWAGGRWWAVLHRTSDGALTIWGLESPTGPWVDTGVLVDGRPFARPQVAWNGSVLVVATTGTRSYASHALQTNRFSWDSDGRSWAQVPDFPVTVTSGPMPDTRLVVQGDGTEWLARREGDALVVARSTSSGLSHERFRPLGDGLAEADVGGFDLTLQGGTPQMAWRSRTADVLHVATWSGERWRARRYDVYGVAGEGTVAIAAAGSADPGALVILTSSSLGARGSNDRDPGLLLSVVEGEQVRTSVVSRLADGMREASLVMEPEERRVRVVALGPPAALRPRDLRLSAPVVEKTASLADLAFAPGQGRPLLYGDVGTQLAPPVVPPDAIDETSGLLVMVTGGDLSGWRSAVAGGDGEQPGSLVVATGPVTVVHDTFDGLAPGGPAPSSWHGGSSQPLEAELVEAPGTGRALLVTNRDGGPASLACRAVPTGAREVTIRADVTATGAAATDARLLTVRGPDGTLVAVRLSRKGEAGWSGDQGRVVAGAVPLGTPLRVTVSIDAGATTASVRIETAGSVVAEDGRVPLRAGASGAVDEVCIGPGADDPSASLLLTDLLVRQR
jgi:hypothetical protein